MSGFRSTEERELALSLAKRFGLEGQWWDRFAFPESEIFTIIDETPIGLRGISVTGGMAFGPYEWDNDDPYNAKQGQPEVKRFRLSIVDHVAKFVVEAKTSGLWSEGRFTLGST